MEHSSRAIAIIFDDMIAQIEILKETKIFKKRKSDYVCQTKTKESICDKLVYLMDIMTNISPASSLYALYGLWFKNIISLKNLDKVQEDMILIRKMYKDHSNPK